MKLKKFWLLTMAVLLCGIAQINAATIDLGSWTSTNHEDNSVSEETFTFTLSTEGTLLFDWFVSSEGNYDWLRVYLDGMMVLEVSGVDNGTYINDFMSSGEHTLVVQYSKDSSVNNGDDQASVTNICVYGIAEEIGEATVDGLSYKLMDDGTATVSALADNTMTDVVIPATITVEGTEYAVTSIGERAFERLNGITSVTISEGVTSVGHFAFYYCRNLETVTILGALRFLGDYAFQYCTSLENLTFSEGLIRIGKASISHCEMLKEITLPNSVQTIGEYAFDYSGLESINIPNSVTSIDDLAFSGCTALKELTIADGYNSLSLGRNGEFQSLFFDCPLEALYLGRDLEYNTDNEYGCSPFYGKGSLTSVTIGEGVTNINRYAFAGCTGLASITIPYGVTSIYDSAFDDCTVLKEVVIVDGYNSLWMGYNAENQGLFFDCPLETLYLGRDLEYNTDYEYGCSPFYGKESLTSVTIGEGVNTINRNAFSGCTSLTSKVVFRSPKQPKTTRNNQT